MTNATEALGDGHIRTRRARHGLHGGLMAALLVAGIATLGACEGDNRFTGEGAEFEPRVLDISLPDIARANDTIYVRVDAVALREVSQIILSLRGAVRRDTTIAVDPPRPQISQVVPIPLPPVLEDTLLIVQAQVGDKVGSVSRVREETVVAFGPPAVLAASAPSVAHPGDIVTVTVEAFGGRRIDQLLLSLTGAVQMDTTVAISPPQNEVTREITFQVPLTAQDTLINVAVSAHDEAGLTGPPTVESVALPILPPQVALYAPPSVQAGSMLHLEVSATAMRTISQLRVELRGGVIRDTVINLDPRPTSWTEFVSFKVPGDIVEPEIQARAFALDPSGAIAATDVEFVDVPLGTPIQLTVQQTCTVSAPCGVAFSGHYLDLRVTAQGDRPIKELLFRWRGFAMDSISPDPGAEFGLANDSIPVDPPRADVLEDVSLAVPCVKNAGSPYQVLITARDEADQLSAIASIVVDVNLDPVLENLCEKELPAPDTTDTTAAVPIHVGLAPPTPEPPSDLERGAGRSLDGLYAAAALPRPSERVKRGRARAR